VLGEGISLSQEAHCSLPPEAPAWALSNSYQRDFGLMPLLGAKRADHTHLDMARLRAAADHNSNEQTSGYSFNLSSRGYDPTEVQVALGEWARYAEGLKAQLRATNEELEQARSKSESIESQINADFREKLASVVAATKTEREQVLLAAQAQAQASLSAARKEAGETVAAARREASATLAAAGQEGTATITAARQEAARIQMAAEAEGKKRVDEAVRVAMQEWTEAERVRREESETLRGIQRTGEDLLEGVKSLRQSLVPELTAMRERLESIGLRLNEPARRPLGQQPLTSAPVVSEAPSPMSNPPTNAGLATAGAEVMPASNGRHSAARVPAGPSIRNGASSTRVESLERRWIDQLWSELEGPQPSPA
jgi:hypothetical protein